MKNIVKYTMFRHWINTLVNRSLLSSSCWKVSNILKFFMNFVPKESGLGVKVCKTTRKGKMFKAMKSDFVVDLTLNTASNLEFGLLLFKRFPDWQDTVEKLDLLGLIFKCWELIVPNTEKAIVDNKCL